MTGFMETAIIRLINYQNNCYLQHLNEERVSVVCLTLKGVLCVCVEPPASYVIS